MIVYRKSAVTLRSESSFTETASRRQYRLQVVACIHGRGVAVTKQAPGCAAMQFTIAPLGKSTPRSTSRNAHADTLSCRDGSKQSLSRELVAVAAGERVMLVGGPKDVWCSPASAITPPRRFLQYVWLSVTLNEPGWLTSWLIAIISLFRRSFFEAGSMFGRSRAFHQHLSDITQCCAAALRQQ
jgi:hypothetical protein